MHFSRILVVALAVAAIAAPTAAARPIDWLPDSGASVSSDQRTDKRSSAAVADMRASVAEALAKERKAGQRQLPGPPTWPRNPQPLERPATNAAARADDGVDWATIAIGVGLTFVALGAVTGVTHLIRVRQRPRVA